MGDRPMVRLYVEETARDFYEDRRSDPEPTAPSKAEALDFGCGNGVLTTIRCRGLPGDWKVAGPDISSVAIASARSRFPDCECFTGPL